MKKTIMVAAYLINFCIMVPLIIVWAVAGFIAQSVWAILETLER